MIGGHEGFVRRILGLGEIAKDAITGADAHRLLTVHEVCKCVAIAGQYGVDDAPSLVVNDALVTHEDELSFEIDRSNSLAA